MPSEFLPRFDKIKARMKSLVKEGDFTSQEDIAREILKKWWQAYSEGWEHGVGTRRGSKPPSPHTQNCNARWTKFAKGDYLQNTQGWKMVAEVLNVELFEIVDSFKNSAGSRTFLPSPNMPGEIPLHRLGAISVADPSPNAGQNTVYADAEREQTIGLSVRVNFGSIRNEDFYSEDGEYIANATAEASIVYVVIKTESPEVRVLSGLGVSSGEVVIGNIVCRFGLELEGHIDFELRPLKGAATLAGISEVLTDLAVVQGEFGRDDWVGLYIKPGGLQLPIITFDGEKSSMAGKHLTIREQIKRQVLKRGIELLIVGEENQDTTVLSRRFFMRKIFDENLQCGLSKAENSRPMQK